MQPFSHTTADGRPKRSWPTQGDAYVAAQRVSRGNTDGRVRAYPCPTCGRWHVGHAKKIGEEFVSQKGAIIKLLAERPAVDIIDLANQVSRTGISTTARSVALLVWDLQKEGMVAFHERNSNGHKSPTDIKLTPKGIEIAHRAEPQQEEHEVPTQAGPTIPDRIEKVMLDAGQEKSWRAAELVEALELTGKHVLQVTRNALARDHRFVLAGDEHGLWTLSIWRKASNGTGPALGVDRHSMSNTRAGLKAPGGPIERIPGTPLEATVPMHDRLVAASTNGHQPVPPPTVANQAVTAEPQHQNEKPGPGLLDGLALIATLIERAEKRDSLVAAARILEAAGEDELAIATLGKVELTALETEVVELVRRTRVGQGAVSSGQVRPG